MGDASYMIGESVAGKKGVNHLPASWNWKIQLWTLDDCVTFCADELNPRERYTIQLVEPFMILKLRPVLNMSYNLNPGIDHMPKSEKEKQREEKMDKAYYEIFEKKSRRSK